MNSNTGEIITLWSMFIRGVYFAVLLYGIIHYMFFKKNKQIFHMVFVWCLVALELSLVSGTFSRYSGLTKNHEYNEFSTLLEYLIFPCFVMLVYTLLNQPKKWGGIFNAFIVMELPYVIAIIAYLVLKVDYIDGVVLVFTAIVILGLIIYAVFTIRDYHRLLAESYSSEDDRRLDWMVQVFVALFGFFLIYAASSIFFEFYYDAIYQSVYIIVSMAAICFVSNKVDKLRFVDTDIFEEVDSGSSGSNGLNGSNDDEVAVKLKRRFEETLSFTTADITIRTVARLVGMSIGDFSHYLNTVKQTNFNEYVNSLRVELACKLIKEENPPLDEMLVRTGFNSPSTYFRVFKVQTGFTPAEYYDVCQYERRSEEQNGIIRPRKLVQKKKKLDLTNITDRERQLMELIAKGSTTEEQCRELGVTEQSLRVFRSRLRSKLGLERKDNLAEILKNTI